MPQKRVTMRHIAELTGVSRTTVSVVLNNVTQIAISPETRQRILAAASTLNYVPDAAAQNLVRRRAGAVALVVRQGPHQIISDAFLAPVLQGIAAAVKEHDYHVLVELVAPDVSDKYGDLVRSRRADGILLSGLRADDEHLLQLHDSSVPLVLMGQLHGRDIPFVDIDNAAGARTAVKHLIDLGHQSIACITNAPLSYRASSERLTGYRQALHDAGIPYDEKLVREGNFTDSSGAEAMRYLLNVSKHWVNQPTAVFVASDAVAIGVLTAIQAKGLRVPEDIAVVGFDDLPSSRYLDPPLTTIRLPAYELGRRAGQLLCHLIKGTEEEQSSQIFVDTELVIRASCGALSALRADS